MKQSISKNFKQRQQKKLNATRARWMETRRRLPLRLRRAATWKEKALKT